MSASNLVNLFVEWLGDIFGGLAGWLWNSSIVLSRNNTGLVVIVLLLGLLLFLMLRRHR
jgi:hypothetical protein